MNRPSHELFSSAGFAKNQDRAVRARHLLDGEAHRLHRLAFTGEQTEVAICFGLIAQIRGFALKSLQLRNALLEFGDALVPFTAPWT